MTTGQEMEQVYSYNPGARMGHANIYDYRSTLLKAASQSLLYHLGKPFRLPSEQNIFRSAKKSRGNLLVFLVNVRIRLLGTVYHLTICISIQFIQTDEQSL